MLKDNNSKGMEQTKKFTPQFMMCPPEYFKVLGPAQDGEFFNDQSKLGWYAYQKNPSDYLKKATEQWLAYKQTLETVFGADVILVEPQPELCDQVFTADATLSLVDDDHRISIISQFTHPQRQDETLFHEQILNQLDVSKRIQMDLAFEGVGDNLYDRYRDCFWSGFTKDRNHPASGRSDKIAHEKLAQATGVQVHSIQVVRPFFHVDTTMSCLHHGHLVVYKGGMSPESYDLLITQGLYEYGLDPATYLIEVTKQEALDYACNMVNIGNKIVMTDCGERVKNYLTELGYEVHCVDVSAFMGAGGGPHCLVNLINQPRHISSNNQE